MDQSFLVGRGTKQDITRNVTWFSARDRERYTASSDFFMFSSQPDIGVLLIVCSSQQTADLHDILS